MKLPDWEKFLTAGRSCLLIGLLWAGIYLPALGSTQLKREEPRRALPALHMLQTGDWLVPRVGADAYLRKPPLLNWLIALSFRVGGQGELAARLPSVLAMLGLALALVTISRRWLGAAGALLAAVFSLTNFAVLDIGRLAELEALYLSCTGVALILWLTGWRETVNPWRLWCAPAPFLALGTLTKGPAHLLIFYGITVAVLLAAGELRALRHPAHAVALLVTWIPFLAWAVPCASVVGRLGGSGGYHGAWGFWWHEIFSRVAGSETARFPIVDWLLRVPQGFANFMPWTVLLPLLWSPAVVSGLASGDRREAALFRGMRAGMVAIFLVLSLLPGGSARYVYPLLVIPGVLLARVLCAARPDEDPLYPAWLPDGWRRVNGLLLAVIAGAAIAMPFFVAPGSSRGMTIAAAAGILFVAVTVGCWRHGSKQQVPLLALTSSAGMILITALYAFAVAPRLDQPNPWHPREIAASIRKEVPTGKTLAVLDDGYQAFWYYLEPQVVYFRRLADLGSGAKIEYFLIPAGLVKTFTDDAGRFGIELVRLSETDGRRHGAYILLARARQNSKI